MTSFHTARLSSRFSILARTRKLPTASPVDMAISSGGRNLYATSLVRVPTPALFFARNLGFYLFSPAAFAISTQVMRWNFLIPA